MSTPGSATQALQDLDTMRAQLADVGVLGLGGVAIGAGTLRRIGAFAAALRRGEGPAAIICDRQPMTGADGEVKGLVAAELADAGLDVKRVIVGDTHAETHADPDTIAAASAFAADAGVLITVGSGTVADVGKAVSAHLGGRPHVIVQTAGSVNGFADDQSVLLRDGVKRTTPTRWPDLLLIDTAVVARAPAALNRAGLGDLLATYTAPADWLLAQLVGQDDSYAPAVVALARRHVDGLLAHAAGIGVGDQEAIAELCATLALSGISMGVAGRTAPGSGMEHTVSHLLEMAQRPDEPEAWHGAKVGVLSVLSALLWDRVRAAVRAGALRQLRFPEASELRDRVLKAFQDCDPSGAMGEECWADYARKLTRWHAAQQQLRTLPERWPGFDAQLDNLLGAPRTLVDALRAAGAPLRLGELGIDADRARWALANCHLMRDRFTVADLAFFMGAWEDHDVDELLGEAAQIGAGL